MINQEEIKLVAEAASESIASANNRILDAKAREQISTRMMEWMVAFNVSRIFSVDGIKYLTSFVFGDALFRDYVTNMCASFYMRLPSENDLENRLAAHVAKSCLLYVSNPDNNGSGDNRCAIPNEITARSATVNDAISILASNRWLMMLIIIREYYEKAENRAAGRSS